MLEEKGNASGPASWADLPVEILDQILILCDTPTLLCLGKLNRTLNLLALEQLFKREMVPNPKQGYVVSRLAPKEVVPALNAALWITYLPHVTYYLNPDVKQLFNEVKGIANLIGRMPTNERLDLYFSSVDRWFADLANLSKEGELIYISATAWQNMFVTLLQAALRKGCKSLRVEGGHRLETYYVDKPPSKEIVQFTGTPVNSAAVVMPPPFSNLEVPGPTVNQSDNSLALVPIPRLITKKPTLRRKVVYWFKKQLGLRASASLPPMPIPSAPAATSQVPSTFTSEPSSANPVFHPPPSVPEPEYTAPDKTAVTSFLTTSPSLTTLNLRSSMMMQPLFFPHTINLIRNHSSVLRHLEIVSVKVGVPVWEKFFKSLTLPALQEFIYLYDTLIVEELFITPKLLLDFFTRHPKLCAIELYGVSTTSDFPPIHPSLLPNLRSLNAHPQIVSWLLQHRTSCPELSFISLTSEYLASRLSTANPTLNPYVAFDRGITTISTLNRPIHVQFKFSTERDLCAWFSEQVRAGATNTSPIQQLTKVTKLTMSSHYHTKFSWEMLEVIPHWLGLFPELKVLEMIELPFPEDLKGERFVKAVKDAVPGLQTWLVGRDLVYESDVVGS